MKNLNILAVMMKFDYGDCRRSYSFEYENFYKTLLAMKNTNVDLFDFLTIEQTFGREKMNEMLLAKAKTDNYDLIFFCLYQDNFDYETIEKLSKITTTYNWFCDDHWRYDDFSKHYTKYFSYVSTTDQNSLIKYKKDGFDNVLMTQWACNHYEYEPFNIEKKYDVSFIGQPHSDRKKIVRKLRSSGININVFGHGWKKMPWIQKQKKSLYKHIGKKYNIDIDSGRASQYDMIKIFNQTKINLNFSGNKQTSQIKGRNFEIPGTCSFMLTEKAAYLEQYYDPQNEVLIYKDIDDLVEKIKHFLAFDDERELIAKNAYDRTINEHTYEKRFIELFRRMGLLK